MTQNHPHCTADELCGKALQGIPGGWHVRSAKPIRLPDQVSKPEPDRCVVRGTIRDYSHRSPGSADIAMIVEVSDSSLSDDRKLARVYGGSGIPAYWIVNLVDRQVEVYTLPYPDGYHSRQDFAPGQLLPVVIDGVEVGRIGSPTSCPDRPARNSGRSLRIPCRCLGHRLRTLRSTQHREGRDRCPRRDRTSSFSSPEWPG